MKQLLLFSLSAFLLFINTLSANQNAPKVEIIRLEGPNYRYPLKSWTGKTQIYNLCNLEPGRNYSLHISEYQSTADLWKLTLGATPGGKDYTGITNLEFRATEECMNLELNRSQASQGNEGAYITIQCLDCTPPELENEKIVGISTTNNSNALYLIEQVFIGGGCFDVSGANAGGRPGQIGTFSSGASSIGLDEGIIISTGAIATASGPNNSPSASTGFGGVMGDPDLDQLSGGNSLYDIAKIEFDFRPTVSQISFQYAFASEEYCEYANSQFNDIFGFFISGPGISGPFTNSAANIAVLPDGQPVAINSVNHTSNQPFYHDNNPPGQSPACNTGEAFALSQTQYDGFTVPLTAIANVIPCQTYHIKLIIADRGDAIYDSAVFLKANSFNAGSTVMAGANITGLGPSTTAAYEGCGNGVFVFTRQGDLSDPYPISFEISPQSTATPGVDYAPIPTNIVIPAGQSSITIPVTVFDDAIPEGIEIIMLSLQTPCSCTASTIMFEIHDPPPVTVSVPDVYLCSSVPTTIVPTVTGGLPGYTYLWNNNTTGPTLSITPNAGAQFYSVTVSDHCGQSANANFAVYASSPTAALSGTGTICQGNFNAYLNVSFTGFGPYDLTYSVDGFEQTVYGIAANPFELPVNLPGTVHLVSVSANGCPGQVSGTGVVGVAEVLLDADITPIACNGQANGVINITPSGGTGPYSYNWNGTLPDVEDAFNLGPGNYKITVTDAAGCKANGNYTLTQPPVLNASVASVQNIDCNHPGNGSVNLNVSGGTPGYSYAWSNSDTVAVLSAPAGSYSVTVTDANGCSKILNTSIANNTSYPTAVAAPSDQLDCNTASILLNSSGSTTGAQISYQWLPPAGVSLSNPTQPQVTVNIPGDYRLVVVNNLNGCRDTALAVVQQDIMPPTIAVTTPDTLTCNLESIILDGSGSSTGSGINYLWTAIGGGNIVSGAHTATPTIDAAGDYTFEITNADNGCTSSITVSVPEDVAAPVINLGPPNDVNCYEPVITVDASASSSGPQFTYQWTTSDGNIVGGADTPVLSVDQGGVYLLEIVNTDNGCSSTRTVNIIQDQNLPVAEAGSPVELNCQTSSALLDGSGSSTGAQFDYQWANDTNGINADGNTLSPTVGAAGVYYLTVLNLSNGCSSIDSVAVMENSNAPHVEAAVNGLLTCDVTLLTIDGSGSDSGAGFTTTWSSPDGNPIQSPNTLHPKVSVPGTYILTVTNQNNSCISTAIVVVDQDITPPEAIAGPSTILTCNEPDFTLDATASSSGPDFSANWQTNNGTILGGNNTLTPTIGSAGSYFLTVKDIQNGCTSRDTVIITANQTPPAPFAGQNGELNCAIGSYTIQGFVTNPPVYNYEWKRLSDPAYISPNTLTPTVSQGGQYVLVVTNPANGCVASDTVAVAENFVTPVADAGPAATLTCVVTSMALNGQASSQGAPYSYQWSTTDGNIVSGAAGLSPQINAPGTYQLIVSHSTSYCRDTATVAISQDIAYPTVEAGAPFELTCFSPSIVLNGAGTSQGPVFEYSWTGPNLTQLFQNPLPQLNVTEPGHYFLKVRNTVNGCENADEVVIDADLNYPVVDAGPGEELNCAVGSYVISASATNTGSNFNLQWITLSGTQQLPAASLNPVVNTGGTFELVVTNQDNGCQTRDTVEVTTNFDYPIANAGPAQTLTCADTVLSLYGLSSSQGSVYHYQWTTPNGNIINGDDSLQPLIDAPGLYQLVIQNTESACTDTATVLIAQDVAPPVVSIAEPVWLDCHVLQVPLDAGGSSTGPDFTYQWSTSTGNIISGNQSIVAQADEPGDYTLDILNTHNGCRNSADIAVVRDPDIPQAVAQQPAIINCYNPVTNLSGANTNGAGQLVYHWQGINTTVSGNPNLPSTTTNAAGTYVFTVTNLNNNCASSDTISVAIDTIAPVALAGPDPTLTCAQTSLALNGIGSSQGTLYAYQWTSLEGHPISAGTTLLPTVTIGGNYNLLVTNTQNGCIDNDLVFVQTDTLSPVLTIAPPDVVNCANPQRTLQATANGNHAMTYQWTTAGGNILTGANTLTPTINAAGSYQLQVLNTGNGCISLMTAQVAIDTIHPMAEAGPTDVLNCTQPSLGLSGTGSSTGSQFTYLWTTVNGQISNGATSLTPTIVKPGMYNLQVTDNSNGCKSNDDVLITQDIAPPQIAIAAPGTLTCAVTTINLQASSDESATPYNYAWHDGSGNLLTPAGQLLLTVTTPGNYSLNAINTDNGCSSDVEVTVLQDIAAPTAEAGPSGTLTCVTTELYLDGEGSSTGIDYVYNWTAGNQGLVQGANTLFPLINQPGNYTLVVTNTRNGCTNQDVVNVIEEVPTDAQIQTQMPLCYGDKGALNIQTVAGGFGPYLYSIDGGTSFSSKSFYPYINPGNYHVVVQDANGCEYEEDVPIIEPEQVRVVVEAQAKISLGDSYQINAQINLAEDQIGSIQWTPADDLSCSNCVNPLATPTETKYYTIRVTNLEGCPATDRIQIVVDRNPAIYIPNAFSPHNNDGTNDRFVIYAKANTVAKINSLMIFNRWGEMMFEVYNFPPNDPQYGWDGYHRSEPMNPGVFVYWTEVELIDGTTVIFKGDVTLMD